LIGRQHEEALLMSCFDCAIEEKTREFVLVSGPSGTGKTTLATTLKRKARRQNVLFISGKFDLCFRGEPYSGIISAVSKLIEDLMLHWDDRLDEGGTSATSFHQMLVEELGSDLINCIQKIIPKLKDIMDDDVLCLNDDNASIEPHSLNLVKNQVVLAFRQFFRVVCSVLPILVFNLNDLQ
jgi:predicted ATPase